jgi:hypothetical protein
LFSLSACGGFPNVHVSAYGELKRRLGALQKFCAAFLAGLDSFSDGSHLGCKGRATLCKFPLFLLPDGDGVIVDGALKLFDAAGDELVFLFEFVVALGCRVLLRAMQRGTSRSMPFAGILDESLSMLLLLLLSEDGHI